MKTSLGAVHDQVPNLAEQFKKGWHEWRLGVRIVETIFEIRVARGRYDSKSSIKLLSSAKD